MAKIFKNCLSQIVLSTSMLTLVACGGSKGGSGSSANNSNAPKTPSTQPVPSEQRKSDEGIYRAIMKPLNTSVVGNTTNGNIIINIKGDEVVVKGRIIGAPANEMHRQQIRKMPNCPSVVDDINSDGYIDVLEMMPSSGPVLIPLDRNINEQFTGMNNWPIANATGTYVYKTSASLSRLLADLRDMDPDKYDDLSKLAPEEDLNLEDRHIVIYGISSDTKLPPTVAPLKDENGDLSAEQSLPIACGELIRITSEEEATVPVETPTVSIDM